MKRKMSLGAFKEGGGQFLSLEWADFFVLLGKVHSKWVPSAAVVPMWLSY